MNKLQEKKLRKIIRNLILEGEYPASMFAGLQDTPGAKKLSKSNSTDHSKTDSAIKELILRLRNNRNHVARIYGKNGQKLLAILDKLNPVSKVHRDEDPTQYLDVSKLNF